MSNNVLVLNRDKIFILGPRPWPLPKPVRPAGKSK